MKRILSLLLALSCLLAVIPIAHAQQSNILYKLGDTVEDFTVTLSDGQEVSLYGLLEEKEAVLINFWASWCGWCQYEFPFLNSVCSQMSEQIGTICLTVEPTDTDETVLRLQQEWDADALSMGRDTIGLVNRFHVEGLPTSILVDRYGVICNIHVGAFLSCAEVFRLLSCVVGDDYETALIRQIPEMDVSEYTVIISGAVPEENEEIVVQICDDSACMLKKPDAEGVIWFLAPSGAFQVHVLQVPQGYFLPAETYTLDPDNAALVIALQKE